MLKKLAMWVGAAFLLVGLLGFVPGIVTTDSEGMSMLLGLFMVDTVHNVVHILTGVVGLLASTSAMYAKWYFLVFGGVYALVTLLGFMGSPVLGFLAVNDADNWLHLLFAVLLLGIGLLVKDSGGGNMGGGMPAKPAM